MNLSSVKHEILEALFLHSHPVKPAQLAKELEKEFPSVMMHLLGLVRLGYVFSSEKGFYAISEKGKKALGLPEVTKEKALEILAQKRYEEGFYFYEGIGKPLNLYANGLLDFCAKLVKISTETVEFHLNRGDFGAWFTSLGDAELTKKTSLLKQKKLKSEELFKWLQEIAQMRCKELSKIVAESASASST